MAETSDAYKTILNPSEGEFKDRGSKFFAYLKNIKSEEEFAQHLAEVKALHFKARHHCCAYRLLDTDHFRYIDDGEPSGTAGKPIYNQILSFDLVNVSCIVVRYFGGTKLGTSGLINAYKESARDAINNAEIVEQFITKDFRLEYDYALMGTLMDTLKQLNISIVKKEFESAPAFILTANASEVGRKINMIKAQMLGRSINDINEDTVVKGLIFKV